MTNAPRLLIDRLTAENLSLSQAEFLTREFALEMGWRPSSSFNVERLQNVCNAHLIVEHGLSDAAMLTFMKGNSPSSESPKDLLVISYNNLVDWHLQIYSDRINVFYNRTNPPTLIESFDVNNRSIDSIHRRNFDIFTDRRPNPNLPSLDMALISSISEGKLAIFSSFRSKQINIGNEQISALYNALILIRAIEDYKNNLTNPDERIYSNSFIFFWQSNSDIAFSESFEKYINACGFIIPEYLINLDNLRIFDHLERYVLSDIIRDLYKGKYYGYDFSVISKHSLSKIYEHYMSVLYYKETEQPYLLVEAQRPLEKFEKAYGSIYTPQYIAKFFTEIADKLMGKHKLIQALTLDPACGSGIFLRNIAERKIDLSGSIADSSKIFAIINEVHGIDKNANAAFASQLSMALLSYSVSGKFPDTIPVRNQESLTYLKGQNMLNMYDLILANPPFISSPRQEDSRDAILNTLGELSKGRSDIYLAFLKASIDALKPGGFGMFVVPQSFLNSNSGLGVRKYIYQNCSVKYICDLSEIDVFPGTGAYVILLIVQKSKSSDDAVALRVISRVGEALDDVITGIAVSNPSYSIYSLPQITFSERNWVISNKQHISFESERNLANLGDFIAAKQGFISGDDDTFIKEQSEIPDNERDIWPKYLPDKDIDSYSIDAESQLLFFMPYIDGIKIPSFDVLTRDYPVTALILKKAKKKLEQRKYLHRYNKQWWEPAWPRSPKTLLVPKIVTPQVLIYPRFAYDIKGEFGVSHSPYIVPKLDNGDSDLLYLILPILNSTYFFWNLTNNSPKYRGGYFRISAQKILESPVPNITTIPENVKRSMIDLTKKLILKPDARDSTKIQKDLDEIVFKLYGIDSESFIKGL